jgi:hypothetical protein
MDKQDVLKNLFKYDEVVYHLHISTIVKLVTQPSANEKNLDDAIFHIHSLKKFIASCKENNICFERDVATGLNESSL